MRASEVVFVTRSAGRSDLLRVCPHCLSSVVVSSTLRPNVSVKEKATGRRWGGGCDGLADWRHRWEPRVSTLAIKPFLLLKPFFVWSVIRSNSRVCALDTSELHCGHVASSPLPRRRHCYIVCMSGLQSDQRSCPVRGLVHPLLLTCGVVLAAVQSYC